MNDNLDIKEWVRFAQMDYDAAKNMSALFHPVPLEIVSYYTIKKYGDNYRSQW